MSGSFDLHSLRTTVPAETQCSVVLSSALAVECVPQQMHQPLGIWWKCCLEWGVSLVCPKLAELLINGVASAPTLQAAWPPHLLALLGYASTHYWWYCPAFFSCCVLRRVKLGWNTLNCSLFNGQCWYMCQDAQCLKPLKQPLLSSCKFPLLWLTLQPLSFAFLTCSHTFLAGFQHFNFFLFFFFATESHGVHTWWESFWLENMLC